MQQHNEQPQPEVKQQKLICNIHSNSNIIKKHSLSFNSYFSNMSSGTGNSEYLREIQNNQPATSTSSSYSSTVACSMLSSTLTFSSSSQTSAAQPSSVICSAVTSLPLAAEAVLRYSEISTIPTQAPTEVCSYKVKRPLAPIRYRPYVMASRIRTRSENNDLVVQQEQLSSSCTVAGGPVDLSKVMDELEQLKELKKAKSLENIAAIAANKQELDEEEEQEVFKIPRLHVQPDIVDTVQDRIEKLKVVE